MLGGILTKSGSDEDRDGWKCDGDVGGLWLCSLGWIVAMMRHGSEHPMGIPPLPHGDTTSTPTGAPRVPICAPLFTMRVMAHHEGYCVALPPLEEDEKQEMLDQLRQKSSEQI